MDWGDSKILDRMNRIDRMGFAGFGPMRCVPQILQMVLVATHHLRLPRNSNCAFAGTVGATDLRSPGCADFGALRPIRHAQGSGSRSGGTALLARAPSTGSGPAAGLRLDQHQNPPNGTRTPLLSSLRPAKYAPAKAVRRRVPGGPWAAGGTAVAFGAGHKL
jgi:hypothetical protein